MNAVDAFQAGAAEIEQVLVLIPQKEEAPREPHRGDPFLQYQAAQGLAVQREGERLRQMLDHGDIVDLTAVENPVDELLDAALERGEEEDEGDGEDGIAQDRVVRRRGEEEVEGRGRQ